MVRTVLHIEKIEKEQFFEYFWKYPVIRAGRFSGRVLSKKSGRSGMLNLELDELTSGFFYLKEKDEIVSYL